MTISYLISPAKIDLNKFKKILDNTLKIGQGSGAFQLRLKNTNLADVRLAVKELLPICHEYGVPFFINDFYELARDYNIDGIHVGQEDCNVAILKKEFKDTKIIGVSCQNSKHSAMLAAEQGADYISFGAFFPTNTKKNTVRADMDILHWWIKYTKIPCAAIGGITLENITKIIVAKPDFICILSAIWNSSSPGLMLKKFNNIINN